MQVGERGRAGGRRGQRRTDGDGGPPRGARDTEGDGGGQRGTERDTERNRGAGRWTKGKI